MELWLSWGLDECLTRYILAQQGNRGLLECSEENLEKMHKIVRRTREKKSRLSGPRENLTDMLNK